MADMITRTLAYNRTVRGLFIDGKNMVEKARITHNLSPVAAAALGRSLLATAMMSCLLKNEKDTITFSMNGKGPIGSIVSVGNTKGDVKGYVSNPQVEMLLKNNNNKLDVGRAVGTDGKLNIIRDMGLKRPYIGSVNIQTGEIAEDLAYYYANSEQIPSIIALGVLIGEDLRVKQAGGYMIQLMPGAGDDVIDYFEKLLPNIKPVTTMLDSGMELIDISDSLLLELTYKINEERDVNYKCDCSYDRMLSKVLAINKKDVDEIIQKGDDIEVVCHFCNKKYDINIEDIKKNL